MIGNTLKPLYTAAIFTYIRKNVDEEYDKMNEFLCTKLDNYELKL